MDFEKYKNPMPRPATPKSPRLVTSNPSAQEARAYAEMKEQYDFYMEEYRAKEKEWSLHSAMLEAKFIDDLVQEVFGSDSKKYPNTVSLLFQKAWRDGHSGGHSEVHGCLLEYQDLFETIKKDLAKQEGGSHETRRIR